MPANGASINEPRRRATDEPWIRWLRRALSAVGLGLFVLLGLYGASRARLIDTLKSEVMALHSEVVENQKDRQRQILALGVRIDELERTLFGEVVVKVEQQRRVTTQETWSKNRDEELRRRIVSLEMRLLQLEQREK